MEQMAAYPHAPPDPMQNHPHHPYHHQAPPPSAAPLPPPQQQQQQQLQPHLFPPPHLHHPPPQHLAYPPYPGYLPPPSPLPSSDDVRTLFIAGLPDDVMPREIYNLFRGFPGYQSCQLKCTGQSSQAFAFAVFSDQQSAINAMHAVNGLMFDLEKESTLYIDIAKSNSRYSRSKRSRTDDETTRFSDKKVKGPGAFSRGLPDSGVGSNVHLSGMGNSAHSMNGLPPAQSQGNFDPEAGIDTNLKKFSNNSPCPTLFVANLGLNCTEQGLNQIFSSCPGFLKLKMQNKRGVPVAFVDFQDVASSTVALRFLQGSPQFSLDGEGMRLEYAKSRMGMRKRERRS
ncbi:hypothetical protein AAC387_Pa05g1914 [Persea americana]